MMISFKNVNQKIQEALFSWILKNEGNLEAIVKNKIEFSHYNYVQDITA